MQARRGKIEEQEKNCKKIRPNNSTVVKPFLSYEKKLDHTDRILISLIYFISTSLLKRPHFWNTFHKVQNRIEVTGHNYSIIAAAASTWVWSGRGTRFPESMVPDNFLLSKAKTIIITKILFPCITGNFIGFKNYIIGLSKFMGAPAVSQNTCNYVEILVSRNMFQAVAGTFLTAPFT